MRTVIILAVLLLIVIAVGLWAVRRQRTNRLRQRFGGEYDHALDRSGSRRQAEQALTEVAQRRDALTLHPLTPQQRAAWTDQWGDLQARFVDAPAEAVTTARDLLPALMQERGYPVEDFDDRAALLAADHPVVVGEYRSAEEAYQRHQAAGGSSTEALRQALVHYRALFEALLEPDGDPAAHEVPPHHDATGPRREPAGSVGGAVHDTDVDAGPQDPDAHGRHVAKDVPTDQRGVHQ